MAERSVSAVGRISSEDMGAEDISRAIVINVLRHGWACPGHPRLLL
jgi:hypothetical protein